MPSTTVYSIPTFRLTTAAFGLVAVVLCSQVQARDARTSTDLNFSGNTWVVKNAGAPINTEYHDGWATITEDGLTLYFASNRPGGMVPADVEDGWYMRKDGTPTRYSMYVSHRATRDSPWGDPKLLPESVNSNYSDHSAFQSDDGHWLFFASDRPGGCGGLDLYVSYRTNIRDDMAWEQAVNLGCQANGGPNGPGIESCPIYNGKDSIYFTSAPDANPANLDYKVTNFNERTRKAGAAGTLSISTEHMDAHIDPTQGYVWAVYPDGVGGGDIWQFDLSTHAADPSQWEKPARLLPAPVNTKHEEHMPSVTKDGQILSFVSDRPGGAGGLDIYEAIRTRE